MRIFLRFSFLKIDFSYSDCRLAGLVLRPGVERLFVYHHITKWNYVGPVLFEMHVNPHAPLRECVRARWRAQAGVLDKGWEGHLTALFKKRVLS